MEYDPRDLFVASSTDALGNTTRVTQFDFRVLAPSQVQDSNDNLSEVRFDVLGMPTAMAVSGKNGEGDNLGGFDHVALNPEQATLISFFVTDEYSPAQARGFLGNATARHLYYFGETEEQLADGTTVIHWGEHPACAGGIVREQHVGQQPDSPVQSGFEYSDGSGNLLVNKVQAEPKLPNGPLRWVASGKTILNNKGKPVKQYEPYFSPPTIGQRFEEPVEIGVTPIVYYDAAGRVIRTEAPDGSYSRVEFSPWHVTSYDASDTAREPGNAWFARMSASALPAERHAARLAAAHADTPAVTLLDSLGREVITIAHNRSDGVDAKYLSFSKLDAEGKPLWVQDARGNRVMQYVTPPLPAGVHRFNDPQNLTPQGCAPCYDIAGNLLFQHSMDAGERWMLNDAAGKPLFAWNSRGFRSRAVYDALHRPTGIFVLVAGNTTLAGVPRNAGLPAEREVLVEKRVYGERHPDASANLRGKPYRVYDSAGVATSARYDFKGNLLTSNRRFGRDYKTIPDWSALALLNDLSQIAAAAEPLLEPTPPLISHTTFDALNRPVTATAPDGSVYQPGYNAANLLERVDLRLGGAAATPFVTNIDYDAKGQRVLIAYGNGATTGYEYDPLTFRLIGLQTTRPANPDATASLLFKSPAVVQDLRYIYDPVGNITRIEDAALRTTAQAGAACDYTYDALYRLTAASGREHSGQTDFALGPADGNRRDEPFVGQRIHPNDLQGLGGYVERYRYDPVGNIMQLAHHAGSDLDQPGPVRWQRHYQYALDSNRLLAASLPGDPDGLPEYVAAGAYSARYGYDAHGNMTGMPHLPLMRWDYKDQLCASSQQVMNNGTPETTYYVYDAAGQRARKVTESQQRTVAGQVVQGDQTAFKSMVILFHENGAGPLRLGEDATDPEGRYAITYTLPAGADHARLRVAAFDANDQRRAEATIDATRSVEVVNLTVQGEGRDFRVVGRVASDTRAGVGGLRVLVVDKNIGGDVTVFETTTGADGSYQAAFAYAGQKQQPDLQARVFSGETLLGASEVRYNASNAETLNVLVEAAADTALLTEHETLTGDLAAHFAGNLRDLKETDGQQDVTYLANKSGWDARAVALAALADQFSARTPSPAGDAEIHPALFYALFRAGLPANDAALYRADSATVSAIWKQILYNTHSLPSLHQESASKRTPFYVTTTDDQVIASYQNGSGTPLKRPLLKTRQQLTDRVIKPNQYDLRDGGVSPFFYEDRRHVFYVTTTRKLVTISNHQGYGGLTLINPGFTSHIPALVLQPKPRILDRSGPVSVEQSHAISNPAPIERFVSEDAYIKQALGSVGSLRFGDNELGMTGALSKQR